MGYIVGIDTGKYCVLFVGAVSFLFQFNNCRFGFATVRSVKNGKHT